MSLRIAKAGLLTTVQDHGRIGFRHYGVTGAGALDLVSFALGNQLVGNPGSTPSLEITLVGPTIVFERPARIAITGADVAATVGGTVLPTWRPVDLPEGAELCFGLCERGCRTYLAIDGGIGVAAVMGSASTDLRGGFGGLGGRALTAGAGLPLGTGRNRIVIDDPRSVPWFVDPRPDLVLDSPAAAGVLPGADALATPPSLFEQEWIVSADSNRQALRLGGASLVLEQPGDRVSEPVAAGTIQLPPSGAPIVLLSDAQTVGGYPRIGHVRSVDLPRLGQLRPGETLRFAPATHEQAAAAACARRIRLAKLAAAIQERLHGS